LPRLEREQNAT
jgi:hypothetical protein